MYTVLKIDEVNNLGAARIRLRSLISVMEERERNGIKPVPKYKGYIRQPLFTKEMKKDYTIIAPQMPLIPRPYNSFFSHSETFLDYDPYKLHKDEYLVLSVYEVEYLIPHSHSSD